MMHSVLIKEPIWPRQIASTDTLEGWNSRSNSIDWTNVTKICDNKGHLKQVQKVVLESTLRPLPPVLYGIFHSNSRGVWALIFKSINLTLKCKTNHTPTLYTCSDVLFTLLKCEPSRCLALFLIAFDHMYVLFAPWRHSKLLLFL